MSTNNKLNFCSPAAKVENGTCYSKKSLLDLIRSYNICNSKNKIIVKSTASIKVLWNALNDKLKFIVKDGNDWSWTDIIKKMANDHKIKSLMTKIEHTELKPAQPADWIKNPTEWLSNYDIMHVMKQYESVKNNYYKFLGVFPIDFTDKNKTGCLYEEFCTIDINNYIKQKIKFIGFIINLDKHDEPGSHWTSIFIVIDPKYLSYGAYYCDSVGNKIPKNITDYLKDIGKQLNIKYPDKKFEVKYSIKKNQKSNTECGMFSQVFQIACLQRLKKNKNLKISDIINDKNINDDNMKKLRNSLYRPNIKSILQ